MSVIRTIFCRNCEHLKNESEMLIACRGKQFTSVIPKSRDGLFVLCCPEKKLDKNS